jgi:hypothetical protein
MCGIFRNFCQSPLEGLLCAKITSNFAVDAAPKFDRQDGKRRVSAFARTDSGVTACFKIWQPKMCRKGSPAQINPTQRRRKAPQNRNLSELRLVMENASPKLWGRQLRSERIA